MTNMDTFEGLLTFGNDMVKLYIFLAFIYILINENYDLVLQMNEHKDKFFNMMNKILHDGLLYDKDNINANKNDKDNINANKDKKENNENNEKEVIKYEEKYLKQMRCMDKDFHFNEEELRLYDELYPKMFKSEMETPDKNITNCENKINDIKKRIDNLLEQDFSIETNTNTNTNTDDVDDEDNFDTDEYKMIMINDMQNEIKEIEKEIEEIKEYKQNITEDEVRKKVEDEIKQLQINKHLERLKNCYIIEKTPLGNVIMIYNNKREIFEYYSDNTIPYRYLEPVGRKYVITFNCRPIFIDMEEELKEAEEKLKEKEEQEKMKMEEMRNTEKNVNNKTNKTENTSNKKNVFAKFKSYNKEAGASKSMAPPPKNNINISNAIPGLGGDNKNEKILLKERSNRYSHEGRFSNFNILKKVDKKVVSKKYAMSFSEFKKLQQQSKNA